MARFDWYQATVPAEVPQLREALSTLCQGRPVWTSAQRAPHGYGFSDRLACELSGPVCQLWWGGSHAKPHVVFSGDDAPSGSELLRGSFPGHTVSRADIATDYAESGAYDRLQELALGVAVERGISVGTAGDHLLTKVGRTLYLGSTSSHTRMRLYDKAAELRAKFHQQPDKLCEIPPELARLEFQVRPQTPAAKLAAAAADPVALMGSASWTRELVRRVDGLDLEPFAAGRVWRQADDDRAYAALLAQYGGLIRRRAAEHGSFAALGCQIGHDLSERDKALRGRR